MSASRLPDPATAPSSSSGAPTPAPSYPVTARSSSSDPAAVQAAAYQQWSQNKADWDRYYASLQQYQHQYQQHYTQQYQQHYQQHQQYQQHYHNHYQQQQQQKIASAATVGSATTSSSAYPLSHRPSSLPSSSSSAPLYSETTPAATPTANPVLPAQSHAYYAHHPQQVRPSGSRDIPPTAPSSSSSTIASASDPTATSRPASSTLPNHHAAPSKPAYIKIKPKQAQMRKVATALLDHDDDAGTNGIPSQQQSTTIKAEPVATKNDLRGHADTAANKSQNKKVSPMHVKAEPRSGSNDHNLNASVDVDDTSTWPEPLVEYYHRVLSNSPPARAVSIRQKLRTIVVRARKANALWTTDWSKMPIPDFGSAASASAAMVVASATLPSPSQPPLVNRQQKQQKQQQQKQQQKQKLTDVKLEKKDLEDERDGDLHSQVGKRRKTTTTDLVSAASSSPPPRPASTTITSTSTPTITTTTAAAAPSSSSVAADSPKMVKIQYDEVESDRDLVDTRRDERLRRFKSAEDQKAIEFERNQREAKRARKAFLNAGAEGNPDVADWDEFTIVGTCTKLEKAYLRLTSAPDPSTVRPLHILRQTLDLLKSKWKKDHNYTFICDQFKSLRQDLTVQRIKSEFTVVVYETHARIALERGDLGEYNQCQAQLKQLYDHYQVTGSTDEFLAYRILYMLHTMNRRDLFNIIGDLSSEQKKGSCVSHALSVRSALSTGDYHRFFRLYHDAPKMSGYLMDHFVDRERQMALRAIVRAFRPNVSVSYLACVLGFVPPEFVVIIDAVAGNVNTGDDASSASSGVSMEDVPVRVPVDINDRVRMLINRFTSQDLDDVERGLDDTHLWLQTMGAVILPDTSSNTTASVTSSRAVSVRSPTLSNKLTTSIRIAQLWVDCRASIVAVDERVRATFARGVDIKGQIH